MSTKKLGGGNWEAPPLSDTMTVSWMTTGQNQLRSLQQSLIVTTQPPRSEPGSDEIERQAIAAAEVGVGAGNMLKLLTTKLLDALHANRRNWIFISLLQGILCCFTSVCHYYSQQSAFNPPFAVEYGKKQKLLYLRRHQTVSKEEIALSGGQDVLKPRSQLSLITTK